ncbi:MAG: cell division protein FtsL [Finegoldia magna]|uniref:Cell division protein FtsL n=1 Tax=Finegoldia magna TaxID=1260 RepID=A0A233VJI7_FINMA|nr:cell division protein FtsL [Finegoldia magna]MDU5368242.1 cell division protein FtsL [Finegoldia magna]MDU5444453.1 cell division protein FtsL [Finegoldia magna]MDU5976725.1 cell division protein FtsL [Finegoldia magna]MDU7385087.1 cell division protein FtsL [Finegoldia magna]OXZ32561.1 cell division protein FtsL [Finegoldia magna]
MGNAQRKIEVFPQYVEKKEFEVKKIEQTKKLNRPSRKTNLFSTFNKVMICVVICLSILVMNRYSKIQSMSSELKEVKNQLMLTEGNRDVIKSHIESKLTSKNIEEIAKNNLGMQFPENAQIMYLKLEEK